MLFKIDYSNESNREKEEEDMVKFINKNIDYVSNVMNIEISEKSKKDITDSLLNNVHIRSILSNMTKLGNDNVDTVDTIENWNNIVVPWIADKLLFYSLLYQLLKLLLFPIRRYLIKGIILNRKETYLQVLNQGRISCRWLREN